MRMSVGSLEAADLLRADPDLGGGDGAAAWGTWLGSIFSIAIRISFLISGSVWVAYAFLRPARARGRSAWSPVSAARMAARVDT